MTEKTPQFAYKQCGQLKDLEGLGNVGPLKNLSQISPIVLDCAGKCSEDCSKTCSIRIKEDEIKLAQKMGTLPDLRFKATELKFQLDRNTTKDTYLFIENTSLKISSIIDAVMEFIQNQSIDAEVNTTEIQKVFENELKKLTKIIENLNQGEPVNLKNIQAKDIVKYMLTALDKISPQISI